MYRRINVFGSSCSGKSTFAAELFAELKKHGSNVELVTEFVKLWAYQGKKPSGFDQVYIFANQMNREIELLDHIPLIVTDSPIFLSWCYGTVYGIEYGDALKSILNLYDEKYPALNVYLSPRPFNPIGRFSSVKSKGIDEFIYRSVHDRYSVIYDPSIKDIVNLLKE